MRKIVAGLVFVVLVSAGILVMMNNAGRDEVVVLTKPLVKGAVLDPSKISFVSEYDYIRSLSARLIGTDRGGAYRNDLAESISFDSEKKSVNVVLKSAQFSDGSPITANDVYFSFKRLILKGSAHSDPRSFIKGADKITSMDDSLEGMRVIDERTIQFDLNYPIKELLYYFQLADYAILHSSQYKKDVLTADDWTGVVSGPYLLVWDGKDRYFLSRNKRGLGATAECPEKVSVVRVSGDELLQDFKQHNIHFGALSFGDYVKLGKKADEFPQIKFFGFQENAILHLDLNLKSKLFKDASVRQWVRKKVGARLAVPEELADAMKKATQFFIPNSKGYLADSEIDEIIKKSLVADVSQVPPQLKNGFTIRALATLGSHMPENLGKLLTDALGVPVKLQLDIQPAEYRQFLEEHSYEATAMVTAMDYKVLGEALNLQYVSEPSPLLDPTGQIKKLLKEYHSEEDPEREAESVRKILTQMTVDSELIPLYYTLTPYFYDVDKLDVTQMNILESLQIWKLRVK